MRLAGSLGEPGPSSGLCCGRLAGQPLGLQPLAIGVKRLLRRLMVAHGLLGLDPASRIARLALFGCQGFASEGKVFSHGETTRRGPEGSIARLPAGPVAGPPGKIENNPMHSSAAVSNQGLGDRMPRVLQNGLTRRAKQGRNAGIPKSIASTADVIAPITSTVLSRETQPCSGPRS